MTMVCQVCNHPKRLEIDRELVQGKSHQKIAKQFGVDAQAVWRHSRNHLSYQLSKAYETKELGESMDLLARIDQIINRAEQIFQRNYDKESLSGDTLALKALSEQRSTIELLARISAFLHESRAMELQRSQGSYEERRKAEEQEYIEKVLDRLNPAEADLWCSLLEKIHGSRDDQIVPYEKTVWPDDSDAIIFNEDDEPVPPSKPKRKRIKPNPLAVKRLDTPTRTEDHPTGNRVSV